MILFKCSITWKAVLILTSFFKGVYSFHDLKNLSYTHTFYDWSTLCWGGGLTISWLKDRWLEFFMSICYTFISKTLSWFRTQLHMLEMKLYFSFFLWHPYPPKPCYSVSHGSAHWMFHLGGKGGKESYLNIFLVKLYKLASDFNILVNYDLTKDSYSH